jgi:3'-5' exoribonuclease
MILIFQQLINNYTEITSIDIDLVFIGILLHDIGKVKEYSIRNGIPIRNLGYGLIGHFALGDEIICKYIKRIEYFPENLEWKLRHLIQSHHGRKEYGSPIEPQIQEATILYLIDSLDAKFCPILQYENMNKNKYFCYIYSQKFSEKYI